MSVYDKRIKLIFYASVGLDLLVVAVLIALVNPLVGLVSAAALAAGEVVVYWILVRPGVMRQKVLADGQPGEARILKIDAGAATGPAAFQRVTMSLEVRPASGEPYQLEGALPVDSGQLAILTPGAVIPVMIDPENPANVAIGGPEGESALAGAAQDKVREAGDMVDGWEAVNNAIREKGLPAEAAVLKAWELGVNVNGPNPAMGFLLEVRPTDRPSFQAQATCVVAEASVEKFQPGNLIKVKYDPEDLTRVAVVHS
jgi:hypothetical protein